MIVHAENLVAGDVGPWGSTVVDVRPSHYDRDRVLITWTGGAGPGLRGARPEDHRVTVRGRTDHVRVDPRTAARADIAAAGPMADPPSPPATAVGRMADPPSPPATAVDVPERAERQRVHDAAIARLDHPDPRTGGRWTGD